MLLGSALALVLHQRGFVVLHASAVAIDGQAVAFLGNKGWGKSTTTAALHDRGHPLIADDFLAVDLSSGERPDVAPGFPQLKLYADAAEAALGDDPEMLPTLHPLFAEKARRTDNGFSLSSLPLQAIYILERGPRLCIEAVSPREALLALSCHIFERQLVTNEEDAPAHFRRRAQLAGCVPLRRLKRKAALDALPDVARVVEEDVRGLEAALARESCTS